jgi:hypothetical protein
MMKTGNLCLSILFLGCALLLSGCGGGGSSSNVGSDNGGSGSGSGIGSGPGGTTTSSTNPVKSVSVAPVGPTLVVGDTEIITALAKDKNGQPITVGPSTWKWTSSNPAAATVTTGNDHVVVTAVAPGATTLTALEPGSGVTGTTLVTVIAVPAGATPVGGGTGGTGGGGGFGGGTFVGTIYSNTFESGAGPEWSNQTTELTPGTAVRPPMRFLGELANGTVTLSLGSIPTHSTMTIDFDLFVIRTMDGSSTVSGLGPDLWSLSVAGGPTLLNTTFSNITPDLAKLTGSFPEGFFQAYTGSYPTGLYPYWTGAYEANTLGFMVGSFADDAIYHLKYTFPHTGSTVQFNFTSGQTQPISDESWGLKNVNVSVQ